MTAKYKKHKAYYQKWQKDNLPKLNAYNRMWRRLNPEKAALYRRRWWKKNAAKSAHYFAKRRSKLKQLPYEDCSNKIKLLKRERFCRWCCCPLTPNSVTIDHVIPLNRGGRHINDNIVACCAKCNSSKADHALDEWLPTLCA